MMSWSKCWGTRWTSRQLTANKLPPSHSHLQTLSVLLLQQLDDQWSISTATYYCYPNPNPFTILPNSEAL